MAAQASWTQHEPETGDDDRWRVMIAPGEVKVLTLEQLDDLFRLEIIDETTRVWGPQMTGWLPLGVAAGLEAEPKSPGAAPLVASGPPPVRSAPPPPPSRSAEPAPRLVATVPPSPAQVAAAFAAPSPASRPPAAASRPPAAFAPPTAPSGAVISSAQAALFAPVRSVQVPSETLRPMASESDLVFRASRSSSGGWLIALAVLLGAGVTLYRNGVVRDVARSSGQEAIYGRLEAAVGGPSFGTLRAVEQLDATAPSGGPSAARVSVSSRKSSDVAAQPSEPPVVAKAEAPSAADGTVTHAVRLEDLAPAKAEGSNGTGAKPVNLDALPKPEKQVAKTVSAVKRTPAAAAPSHASAVKPRAKDASRMHDPLNPDG